jgi:23S rRNA maturation mini-RNase III
MPLGIGWFIWQWLPEPKDVSVFAAAFGDIVGPLFAALAFFGVIYTVLTQREELSLQRQEMKRTADAQEKSERTMQKQVRATQISAQLNAMTALINFYAADEERFRTRSRLAKAKEARENVEMFSRQMWTLLDEAGEHYISKGSKGPWPPSDPRNQ